jgi:hypothetical protein
MAMPGFSAETAVYPSASYHTAAPAGVWGGGANAVIPQVSLCSPCVQVGGQQLCVNLPFFGRRCLRVPRVGRWRICCRTRFGIPPISCGLSSC